jgi:hypothetical protein
MSSSLTTKGLVSSGSAVTYRMRGFDSTLGRIVYWTTTFADSSASDYSGPGPVIDIVVSKTTGKPV